MAYPVPLSLRNSGYLPVRLSVHRERPTSWEQRCSYCAYVCVGGGCACVCVGGGVRACVGGWVYQPSLLLQCHHTTHNTIYYKSYD